MKSGVRPGSRSPAVTVRWAIVIVCAAFLAWRMIAVNLSGQLMRTGSPEAVEAALTLSPGNPHALYANAATLVETDPEQAEKLLLQAIGQAPTKGRMFTLLGRLLERRGEDARAEQVMLLANKLAPRNSAVQTDLAAYWGGRNRPKPYLQHLLAAAELSHRSAELVRPAMLAVVDQSAYAPLVRRLFAESIATSDPRWWRLFFEYATWKAANLDTVRMLYSIRSGSYRGPTDREKRLFLARLERDGQWTEAYFVWLNALDDEHLGGLGNIFNGAFSFPLTNAGFGWRYDDRDGVEVSTATPRGVSNNNAMRVRFSGRRALIIRLSQHLLLPPGNYEFTGKVRTSVMDGGRGVQWRIKCVPLGSSLVKTSGFRSGVEPWQEFSYRFEVPVEGCEVQQLFLAQDMAPKVGKVLKGSLWFDDLAIGSLD